VSKDRGTTTSPGEVAQPAPAPPPAPIINQDSINAVAAAERARQDSIARIDQMRRDSIAMAERRRADSIAVAERARMDSIARADSVARAAELARLNIRRPGGFYIGLAGGANFPMSDLKNAYKTGYNVTVPFGWDSRIGPFGLRFDAAYDLINGQQLGTSDFHDLRVASLNGDLKLKAPLGRTWSNFYVLGGGGAHRMYGGGLDGPTPATSAASTKFADAKTVFGWNAGAGFSVNWGWSGMFVESRYFSVSKDAASTFGAGSAKFVPVILGIMF
jgi:hypothetical protein